MGFPRSRSYTKLPDASGSGQLPPSPRSPGVIVLASHVDSLVHVALGGRFLARALHRGEDGAGRSPAGDTAAERGAATSLPASSLPPWAPAGAAPAAARSAPPGSFPRRSPALQQEPAPATPPPRAGGANPHTSLVQAPGAPAGTASGVGVARDWLERRGGVGLVLARLQAPAEAWERGLTPGAPELAREGRGGGERERRVVLSS